MSRFMRRTTATVSVAAVAAAISVTVVSGAFASHAGGDRGLSTLRDRTITWQGGAPANVTVAVAAAGGGEWSPDGSRMAFVTTGNEVETVRFNNGKDIAPVALGDTVAKSDPTWTSDGSFIVYAEKSVSDSAKSIHWATSDDGILGREIHGLEGTVLLPAGAAYDNPDGGPNGLIMFDATSGGQTQVMQIREAQLLDFGTPVTPTLVVSDASQPAISPDGTEVAFVRPDAAGHDQIWTSDLNGANVVQVTSNAVDHSNPTWSPDTHTTPTIAFDQGTAVFITPANGSAAANPTPAGLVGVPAYQTTNADTVVRIAGANRFETAVAASEFEWATASQMPAQDGRRPAKVVVLTRSDTFADALAGSALAAAKQGPLLLTPPGSLNTATAAEIKRVFGSTGGTVYILGGTGAISASVETAVRKLGGAIPYATVRLQGANRYGTAAEIAREINPNPDLILVATGLNFPDALAAGAAAGDQDGRDADGFNSTVVLLSAGSNLPAETKAFIDGDGRANPLYGIGRQAADALQHAGYLAENIAGENRYDTALGVAETFFFTGGNVAGIATGANWPDALAGGALMGTLGGPLLLSQSTGVPADTSAYLSAESGAYSQALVFGGSSVVSTSAAAKVGVQIGGVVPVKLVPVSPSAVAR